MLEWTKIAENGAVPLPLTSTSAAFVQDRIYVFGGDRRTESSPTDLSHDLYMFDKRSGFWTLCKESMVQPCARAGHCVVAAGSSLYVLCGWTYKRGAVLYLSDVFVHGIEDSIWTPIKVAGAPPVPRANATACHYRGQIFLFGGNNGAVASSYRNDLMILGLDDLTWRQLDTSTPAPSGRAQHAMACFAGQIFVFGGENLRSGKKQTLSDFYTYDIAAKSWTALPDGFTGHGPSPRLGHSLAAASSAIFLFGGAREQEPVKDWVWVYNAVSQRWLDLTKTLQRTEHHLVPQHPSPRLGMCGGVDLAASTVYLFGGHDWVESEARTEEGEGGPPRKSDGKQPGKRRRLLGELFAVHTGKWQSDLPAAEVRNAAHGAEYAARALISGAVTLKDAHGKAREQGVPEAWRGDQSAGGAGNLSARGRGRRQSEGAGGVETVQWQLLAGEGEPPLPRSGHAMAVIGRRVYVFGGLAEVDGMREYLNDLHVLDLSTYAWSEVQVAAEPEFRDTMHPQTPCGRAGHSMVTVEQGRSVLWVLCGWYSEEGAGKFLNDVYALDPLQAEWQRVETVGEAPVGRAYAGAVVFRGRILLFGGCNGSMASNYRNDLWALDSQTRIWSRIVLNSEARVPPGRAQHSMVQYGGQVYVFGGNNKKGGKRHLLSDLHAYDPLRQTWTLLSSGSAGEGPTRRSGHSMVLHGGGIFVFGGGGDVDGAEGFYDSLWVYDTAGKRWNLLPQEDEEGLVGSRRPCARASHSMVAAGEQVVLFGGLCPNGTGGLRALGDLAVLDASRWRKMMPKVVLERERERATRLLAKIQGLDDHASLRLLDSMHAFRGAARAAYNEKLDKGWDKEVLEEDEEPVSGPTLGSAISAQLAVINQRIDSMLSRVAPDRLAEHQVKRQVTIGPVLAKGGTLTVGVICAKDLPKMDRFAVARFGKADAYVMCEADGQKKKTQVVKRNLNPIWREVFTFKVVDSSSVLSVTCFDWDFADAHDLIGKFEVKVHSLLDGDRDQFFGLRDEDGEPTQGAVQLTLSYSPADSAATNIRSAVAGVIQNMHPDTVQEIFDEYHHGAIREGTAAEQEARPATKPPSAPRRTAGGGVGMRGHSRGMSRGAQEYESKYGDRAWRARVEKRREENLMDMEEEHARQLREEAHERKIREVARLEKLEEDMVREQRREEEDVVMEEVVARVANNIAAVAHAKPHVSLPADAAQQLSTSLEQPLSPSSLDALASPVGKSRTLKPEAHAKAAAATGSVAHPPQHGAGVKESAGVAGTREAAGQGSGASTPHSGGDAACATPRKSVLTTMLGKSSTVEARKRMLATLKAERKSTEQARQEEYERHLEEMRAKVKRQEEEARREREREARESSLEAQRQRERMLMDQEERRKKEAEERRARVLAQQAEEEEREQRERAERQRQVDQRRAENVQRFEEQRSARPAELSRSLRFGQFLSARPAAREDAQGSATDTSRQLNTLRPAPPLAKEEDELPAVPRDTLALTGEIEKTLRSLKH